ncbi:MAG: sulfite exporter TauE/SafE family protein [Planctomycetes bacterium]|nr:sulfite exporter TauE/SafE family protein [Planctomycetota bacterium]
MPDNLSIAWPLLVILGVVAGIISGSLGIGGGVILVPSLILLFSFDQKIAQGMSLGIMVPMVLLGAFRYWKHPDIPIDIPVVLIVICGALVGTMIGTHIAHLLEAQILRKLFAVLLIIVAVRMLIPDKYKNPVKPETPTRTEQPGLQSPDN